MLIIHAAAALLGLYLVGFVLVEGFETVVLPRSVNRSLRLARVIYRVGWRLTAGVHRRIQTRRQESFLSYFGPLSLLVLLFVWALCLLLGFACLQWAQGDAFHHPGEHFTFLTAMYLSGSTLFTLGYGDITPAGGVGRMIAVAEAGTGFGFLAVVIGYLPIMYQSFSKREVMISLLDARAGTPPTGIELVCRAVESGSLPELGVFLEKWEQWGAELLEGHLSYPVMSYYRSQHDGESWLAALTAVLDACALVSLGAIPGAPEAQAHLTYAICRHAAVDIALIFNIVPDRVTDRLPDSLWPDVEERLEAAGIELTDVASMRAQLRAVRDTYEPYVNALSTFFLFSLPLWRLSTFKPDNWQTSVWDSSIKRTRHF